MSYLQQGGRSLGLLVRLNFDWMIWPMAVLSTLAIGQYLSGF